MEPNKEGKCVVGYRGAVPESVLGCPTDALQGVTIALANVSTASYSSRLLRVWKEQSVGPVSRRECVLGIPTKRWLQDFTVLLFHKSESKIMLGTSSMSNSSKH